MSYFATRYAPAASPAATTPAPAGDAATATLSDYLPHGVRKPPRRLVEQVPRAFSRSTIADFVGLIKTIPAELHPRVARYVLRVFNGTADRDGLIRYLRDRCGVSGARARMIADDQIAKAAERMRVEKWRSQGRDYVRWAHGGSGDPRDYHLRDWDGTSGADGRPNGLNGFVFELSNPPVIDPATGERGYPAQLVNCQCHLEPITAEEFDSLAGAMSAKAEADYLAEVMRSRSLPPPRFAARAPAA